MADLQNKPGAAMGHETSRYIGLVGTFVARRLRTAVAAGLALRPSRDIDAVEAGQGVCRGQPSHSLVVVYS